MPTNDMHAREENVRLARASAIAATDPCPIATTYSSHARFMDSRTPRTPAKSYSLNVSFQSCSVAFFPSGVYRKLANLDHDSLVSER